MCGFPPNDDGENVPARDTWRGVEIRRVGVRLDFKRSLAFRAIHYASYLAGAALELLQAPRRLALVVTNPPFLPIWAAFFRRPRSGRFAIEVQDLYPDGLIALSILNEGAIAVIWRWLNRAAFRRAEFVIVLGRDMAERLKRNYQVQEGKIHVVPHWSPVEPTPSVAAEETQLLGALGLTGRFVVQYSGNMGLWHDLEQIVGAAELLRDREDIRFLLIGDGRRRADAQKKAVEKKLTNMIWLPFQSKIRLADSLAACHVALISQREGLEGSLVPCKLYGIMESGRAVIAAVPESSETARVVREEDCGLVVLPNDAKALAGAILALAGNAQTFRNMGENARRAYYNKYTLKRNLDITENVLLSTKPAA